MNDDRRLPGPMTRMMISVDPEVAERLRTTAATMSTNVSVVVRGMLDAAADHPDSADKHIERWREAEVLRKSAVGREAMRARYAKASKTKRKSGK